MNEGDGGTGASGEGRRHVRIVGKIIKNVGSAHHSAHQKKWAYYVGIRRNVYQNLH